MRANINSVRVAPEAKETTFQNLRPSTPVTKGKSGAPTQYELMTDSNSSDSGADLCTRS